MLTCNSPAVTHRRSIASNSLPLSHPSSCNVSAGQPDAECEEGCGYTTTVIRHGFMCSSRACQVAIGFGNGMLPRHILRRGKVFGWAALTPGAKYRIQPPHA